MLLASTTTTTPTTCSAVYQAVPFGTDRPLAPRPPVLVVAGLRACERPEPADPDSMLAALRSAFQATGRVTGAVPPVVDDGGSQGVSHTG